MDHFFIQVFTYRDQALQKRPLDLKKLLLHEHLQLLIQKALASLFAEDVFLHKGLHQEQTAHLRILDLVSLPEQDLQHVVHQEVRVPLFYHTLFADGS